LITRTLRLLLGLFLLVVPLVPFKRPLRRRIESVIGYHDGFAMMLPATVVEQSIKLLSWNRVSPLERRHRGLRKSASIFSCFVPYLDWSFALINGWIGFVNMLCRGTESLSQRRIQYFVSVCQGVEFYAPAGTLARLLHANL
jgi:hypothetical protein